MDTIEVDIGYGTVTYTKEDVGKIRSDRITLMDMVLLIMAPNYASGDADIIFTSEDIPEMILYIFENTNYDKEFINNCIEEYKIRMLNNKPKE